MVATNQITFNDASLGWEASPQYGANVFVADFWLATQYAGKFSAAQIYNIYHKFLLAKDGSGNLPISINITTAAATNYYSGLDNIRFHTTGDPIWCCALLMKKYYDLSADTTNFTADLAVLDTAMQSVPRNGTTHLVSAGTAGNYWITLGFHDGVQKSGDDLIGSILYYATATAMAACYTAIGNGTQATAYTADAALIAANIDTLWSSGSGMYLAASGQCNQIDVNGSAMASYYGLASVAKKLSISNYLSDNASLFNAASFVRQSPSNWAAAWSGSTYDNNYWSWGHLYVLSALASSNPAVAQQRANTFANSGIATREYCIGEAGAGASNNLESAAGAIGFIQSIN